MEGIAVLSQSSEHVVRVRLHAEQTVLNKLDLLESKSKVFLVKMMLEGRPTNCNMEINW